MRPEKGIIPGVHALEDCSSEDLLFLDRPLHIETILGEDDEIRPSLEIGAGVDFVSVKNIPDDILTIKSQEASDVTSSRK